MSANGSDTSETERLLQMSFDSEPASPQPSQLAYPKTLTGSPPSTPTTSTLIQKQEENPQTPQNQYITVGECPGAPRPKGQKRPLVMSPEGPRAKRLKLGDTKNLHVARETLRPLLDKQKKEQNESGQDAAASEEHLNFNQQPSGPSNDWQIPMPEIPLPFLNPPVSRKVHDEVQLSDYCVSDEVIQNQLYQVKRWGEDHVVKMPPINAAGLNHVLHTCKPTDATAQAIIKRNAENLVAAGIMSQQERLQLDKQVPADQQTGQALNFQFVLTPEARTMLALDRLHGALQGPVMSMNNHDYPPEHAPFEQTCVVNGRIFPDSPNSWPRTGANAIRQWRQARVQMAWNDWEGVSTLAVQTPESETSTAVGSVR